MKIALPSDDGRNISPHFGRSRSFVVYEVENGNILSRQTLANNHAHSHECHTGAGHSHQSVVSVLDGVDLVIAGGMGQKMYTDLLGAGIVVMTTGENDCDLAVRSFLSGTLPPGSGCMCGCNH